VADEKHILSREDLSRAVQARTGTSLRQSATMVDALFGVIEEALRNGELVDLAEFGTFETDSADDSERGRVRLREARSKRGA